MKNVARSLFKPIELLRNRNFILPLALVLGFLLGQGAQWTEKIVIPALAFAMMLSTTSITGNLFRSPRRLLAPLLAGFIMNYAVLGSLILILNVLFMLERSLSIGFVIVAAVPPAIAVIPFTGFLGGDLEFSLIGTLGCYLAAFLVTPLMLLSFQESSFELQVNLLITLVELIIIPLILSRILLRTGVASKIANIKGTLINWSFFLVVYTIMGLNQETLLNRPLSLIPSIIIAMTVTFLLGYATEKAGRLLKIDPKKVTSIVLLGTQKNTGFSAALALVLFDAQTALPSAIMNVFMLSYIILMDLLKAKNKKNTRGQESDFNASSSQV
jgi:bile acid:Na+ symporter, BASS family